MAAERAGGWQLGITGATIRKHIRRSTLHAPLFRTFHFWLPSGSAMSKSSMTAADNPPPLLLFYIVEVWAKAQVGMSLNS